MNVKSIKNALIGYQSVTKPLIWYKHVLRGNILENVHENEKFLHNFWYSDERHITSPAI
jgi:hypothetical protein